MLFNKIGFDSRDELMFFLLMDTSCWDGPRHDKKLLDCASVENIETEPCHRFALGKGQMQEKEKMLDLLE